MVEIQPWEEEHSLTIWFPEPIPLVKLTSRHPLSEEAQLPPRVEASVSIVENTRGVVTPPGVTTNKDKVSAMGASD